MRIEQAQFRHNEGGWVPPSPGASASENTLVFLFGSREALSQRWLLQQVRGAYPQAQVVGCSTAGEIYDSGVYDNSVTLTALHFDSTRLRGGRFFIDSPEDSLRAGEQLGQMLDQPGLAHVFVFSDGLHVNGSDLVRGLAGQLPPGVSITGGLAGDADRFQETLVVWQDEARPKTIAAVGLYGDSLRIGCGSLGGWDPFGPDRLITRSSGNVLYELDGKSALDLYKSYLGEHANGLPATGLLFPLSLRTDSGDTGLVRTILAIDESERSLVFAGDIPQGSYARLMKANFDRLIDGATGAATASQQGITGDVAPDIALLVSCVGRKMVLKQRVEEEVEGVAEVLGSRTVLTGFYSYGEISPFTPGARCELHNQTMTITTLTEL